MVNNFLQPYIVCNKFYNKYLTGRISIFQGSFNQEKL